MVHLALSRRLRGIPRILNHSYFFEVFSQFSFKLIFMSSPVRYKMICRSRPTLTAILFPNTIVDYLFSAYSRKCDRGLFEFGNSG